ncbi:MAG: YkgJ family cysteine cluster protein [Cyclobacteriaceae bacterium]|nr:YkgJ family cysteine cluster protein [Cyclobacteriaceae bacterium]
MTLPEKVDAVNQVFAELDSRIATFQSHTGLHCQFGCGKCCFKPDIEASVLEFLPFALYLHQQKFATQWLEQLVKKNDPNCLILNPTQAGVGLCSQYKHRGLICRLFGYSARTNKYGRKELVTCAIIKSEQTAAYEAAATQIDAGLDIPVMNQVYMQLHAIDFELAQKFYPINQAIRHAIETVLQYYAYRD